jgi:hypothetical protein
MSPQPAAKLRAGRAFSSSNWTRHIASTEKADRPILTRTRTLLSSMIATLFVLVACTSSPQKTDIEAEQRPSASRCVPVQDLAEWEPLGERSILLFVPGSGRSRVLVLAMPIEGLPLAGDIEMVDGDLDGFICPGGIDGIYVRDCGCASRNIVSIENLTEQQTAELLGQSPLVL